MTNLPELRHPDAVYHNGEPSDEHPPKELHLFVPVVAHKPTDFKPCDTITNTKGKGEVGTNSMMVYYILKISPSIPHI